MLRAVLKLVICPDDLGYARIDGPWADVDAVDVLDEVPIRVSLVVSARKLVPSAQNNFCDLDSCNGC